MKIDNSRNSMPSGIAGKWEGPDFDANKHDLGKQEIESQAQRGIASSVAHDSKGILKIEGNLRRFTIDRDLDQPDMAKEKKNQFGIKQQILEYPSGH